LHLRVHVIELIELDDYENMPQPVFIKGYLRAYANLLDIRFEPLLEQFHILYDSAEKKADRAGAALWQNKKQSNRAEHVVRWLTGSFALIVLGAAIIWWHSNQGNEHLYHAESNRKVANKKSPEAAESDVKLTDLSRMRSLLSPGDQITRPNPGTETSGD
jgi:cytoskeleton protein RodZ